MLVRERLDELFFLDDWGAKGRLIIIWVSERDFSAAATCINIYYSKMFKRQFWWIPIYAGQLKSGLWVPDIKKCFDHNKNKRMNTDYGKQNPAEEVNCIVTFRLAFAKN